MHLRAATARTFLEITPESGAMALEIMKGDA
jgi:hypothetical protein